MSWQPTPVGLFQTWVWQQAKLEGIMSQKVTTNPSAPIDVNLANGRVTFRLPKTDDQTTREFFVQPGALSFGWSELMRPSPITNEDGLVGTSRPVGVTVIDVDIGGANWLSLKVSQAGGAAVSTSHVVGEQEFRHTTTNLTDGTVTVHRWTRLVPIGIVAVLLLLPTPEDLVAGGAAALELLRGLLTGPNRGWGLP